MNIPNEILLIMTLLIEYTAVVLSYKFFGKTGLIVWTVIATISANIEVLILVDAFGMEMTLGNILFATTFMVTDVLSETHGKEASLAAVRAGIVATISFVVISSSWLLYHPAASDFATPAIKTIFSYTPRLVISSMMVYAIVQLFDVYIYHKIWSITEKRVGRRALLWLRNSGSTLLSQFINAVLFNVFSFYGTYPNSTLIQIIISTYVIFLFTSIADTPFIYLCRFIWEKEDPHFAGKNVV